MTDIAINPVTRRVQFQGTTGTGPFAFSFNILQASDIAVLKNNVVLAIGTGATNYSVSINANGTGSVSLVTALISSDTLIIMGGRELSRTTDFVTAGDLLASSLNEQLDSNVVMSQQLDEKVDRSIIAQPGDKLVGVNLSLPLVADRANELIKFDASGNVTTVPVSEVVGTDIDTQKITIKTSAGATKLVINGNITDLITAADNLTIVSTSGDIDFKPGGGQINLLASTGAQRMALDNTAQPTMQYFQASNVTKLGVVDPTATRTLLLPDASDTLVGKATTDTLTNKTLASPVITGSLGVGTLTGSGDILLDAAGDIVLDAAGDQVFFKDGGTLRITFELGAAGTSIVSASELVMAVTSGGINFKPQTGNVDFLTNSGGQALQINAIGSSTITYYQNSNTTKLGVVNPTGSRVLLLPDASDTLVGKATTDTLTNKTLANPAFTGNLNFSGDVVIDSSGDITLDADGGEIYFKDGGATRLTFQVSAVAATLNSASDFNVNSANDIALKPAGGNVDILGTNGQQRIQFDNTAQATMKYYQNSNTTSLGVVDPTGARALLLPDASDTLVGKATTDTLTNKTLASPTITGSLDMSDVNITNVGSISLDRITNDGAGGITLDSSQGINYDAASGQNLFKVNGQTRLTVALNSSANQTITSLAILSLTSGSDINLRPNGGQLYILNNSGGDNFQFNTSATPTLAIHQNSNRTNLGLVSPTATRNILFPDASDTLVGKATTDTLTNKTLTSPVINTGVSGSAFLDEDNFASNSATKIASQQSIKAYVDAATAGGGAGSLSTVLGIGNTTGSNNVLFGDNNKAIFGAGSDLQIFSDGTTGQVTGNVDISGTIDATTSAIDSYFFRGSHATTTNFYITNTNATTNNVANLILAPANNVAGAYLSAIATEDFSTSANRTADLAFYTRKDGTFGERLRIDSSGNVGIGVSSPTYRIEAATTSGGNGLKISRGADSFFEQFQPTSGGVQLAASGSGAFLALRTGTTAGTTSERMRIDSSGNVGIGTSASLTNVSVAGSESSYLSRVNIDVSDNANRTLTLSEQKITFAAPDTYGTNYNAFINYGLTSLQFAVGNAEAMRIDSSGNVLVGTTESSPWDGTTSGIALRHEGFISAASTGSPAELNRLGSDGNIINLRKDGSPVGSIGTTNGDVYIDSSGAQSGLRFEANDITPRRNGAEDTSGLISLGNSSKKFKDLYLSGGVYLGGTGAANKLSDYEEGTASLIVYGSTSGSTTYTQNSNYSLVKYTKIGRLVHVNFIMGNQSFPTFSGDVRVGLPFTSRSGSAAECRSGDVYFYNSDTWDNVSNFLGVVFRVGANQSFGTFGLNQLDTNRQSTLASSNTSLSGASGIYMRFNITYETES